MNNKLVFPEDASAPELNFIFPFQNKFSQYVGWQKLDHMKLKHIKLYILDIG